MDHQGEHRIGFGRNQRFVAGDDQPVQLARQIGFRLALDQIAQRCGGPVFPGYIVVCDGQRVDPPADKLGEGFDIDRFMPRLVDQTTDEVEDIANPVIEFADQQLLLLLRSSAFLHRLVGQAQDYFQQSDAQAFGNLPFGRGPLFRAPFHRLLPCLEALARGQPVAIRPAFHRLYGVTCPCNRLAQFLAPQHEIIARAARDRNDQRTRRPVGESFRLRDAFLQAFGGYHPARCGGVQHRHHHAEFLPVRGRSARVVNAVHENADAVMRDDPLNDRAQFGQAVHQRISARNGTHQLVVQFASGRVERCLCPAIHPLHHQGEQFRKQFCRGAQRIRQYLGAVMVTGEQSPKLAADDYGNRKRGAHTHIVQIFDVDRRNRAQCAHGQIQSVAIHRHAGLDRNRFRLDIADDAETIAQVKRARLFGDVGVRVSKPEEAFQMVFARFGNHVATSIRMEAIDHHPVEAEHVLEAVGSDRAQLLEIVDRFQLAHDRLDRAHPAVEFVYGAGLYLEDRQPVDRMKGAVVFAASGKQFQTEQPLHIVFRHQQGGRSAQHVHRLFGEDAVERLADFHRVATGQDLARVDGTMGDHPVVGYRDQGAEVLDRTQLVDRLAIAIAEVDGLVELIGFDIHAAAS